MNFSRDKLVAELSRDEGRVPHAYKDSEGYLTIGVGHLIDKNKGGRLPEFIIDLLLEYDIDAKVSQIKNALPWAENLSDARQRVIINMVFNLGITGFQKFHNTIAAIKAEDWDVAAAEMLNSKWARQVGPRAERLAQMMREG